MPLNSPWVSRVPEQYRLSDDFRREADQQLTCRLSTFVMAATSSWVRSVFERILPSAALTDALSRWPLRTPITQLDDLSADVEFFRDLTRRFNLQFDAITNPQQDDFAMFVCRSGMTTVSELHIRLIKQDY